MKLLHQNRLGGTLPLAMVLLRDLARKFNVDPDMSDKVLVPVLNFLDKYGVGDSIAGNPAAQTAGSLIEFLTDVTPVVKNAMEYFAGKQKELSDEDRDFLNQIKEARPLETWVCLLVKL